MTSNKKIKVAIIGFGRIAQKHLYAIKQLEEYFELEAIVDPDPEKINEFARLESIDCYTDIETLIKNK